MDRTCSDAHGCRNSGMPLGGVGAGSLEIRPDGYFYRWMLMNNRPWGAGPATDVMEGQGLRFGLCYEGGEGRRCLALGRHMGLDPAQDGWFWFSDPYHLPWVQHAREVEYNARIPFAHLRYRFDGVPLDIELLAWSPFAPHRAAESNTPGAVLQFRIRNPTDRPHRVSLFGLIKNAAGYDRPDLPSEMEVVQRPCPGLRLRRAGLDAGHVTRGTLGLFAGAPAGAAMSYALHPRHGRDLWEPLLRDGRLENEDFSREGGTVGEIGAERKIEGPKGHTRGALCAAFDVGAGSEESCVWYLTWHFPNFFETERKGKPGNDIGVQYANRFRDEVEVATWLSRERSHLEAASRKFHDALGASSLPAWEKDCVCACLSVLLRACWWDRQSRFGIWEGIGCCGLQTIDVGHYSAWAVMQFFPELDAAQNRLSASNLEPSGKVPHTMPGRFDCNDFGGGRGRIDLCAQYILSVWRHARWTGDVEELRRRWPVMQTNLRWMEATDTDGDGLPNNHGPDQTYDRFPMHGTTAYVGFLYLAALRAMAEASEWLGDEGGAAALAGRASAAAAELDRQLWNGEYYHLGHDRAGQGINSGCMTDQVNGDWFYRQATGTALLDDGKVRRSLASVIRWNRRTAGPHAWLANATWPKGGTVAITRRGSDQANCPWSGVEFAVAAELLWLGQRDEARQTLWDVFERHEDAGMRFNHCECGEFYHRSMSAWAVCDAEFGVAYDGVRRQLAVRPPEADASFVVMFPHGWAAARWEAATGTLVLRALDGEIRLESVVVAGREVATAGRVLREGEELRVAARSAGPTEVT